MNIDNYLLGYGIIWSDEQTNSCADLSDSSMQQNNVESSAESTLSLSSKENDGIDCQVSITIPTDLSLFQITEADIAMVVAYIATNQKYIRADIENVEQYGRVIAMLHREQPILPLRYGAVFATKQEIKDFLRRYHSVAAESLCKLNGYTEMGLRILSMPNPQCEHKTEGSPQSGSAYLKALKQKYEHQQAPHQLLRRALSEEIDKLFEQIAVQVKFEYTPANSSPYRMDVFSYYFLMNREKEGELRQRFRHLSQRHPEKMMLSGPWAPYNFVSDNLLL
jgi:hypothetical protein